MTQDMVKLIVNGIWETFYMVVISGGIAMLLGFLMGITLVVTEKSGIHPIPIIYKILSTVINIVRSIPEIVLIIILLPVARFLVGSGLGNKAAIVSISIGMAPMVARTIQNSVLEVSGGKIEAAQAMGANSFQIITRVFLPESLPSIVHGLILSVVCTISFTAIAGNVGAGGLGAIAIRYGYKKFNTEVMVVTVVLIIAIVQIVEFLGRYWARRINTKKGKGESITGSMNN